MVQGHRRKEELQESLGTWFPFWLEIPFLNPRLLPSLIRGLTLESVEDWPTIANQSRLYSAPPEESVINKTRKNCVTVRDGWSVLRTLKQVGFVDQDSQLYFG